MRVVKLGGSLLDWPDISTALPQWHAAQPAMPSVLVVGGGRLADVFREMYRLHSLSEASAHWLCVRAMQLNSHLAHALWPATVHLDSLAAAARLPPERPGLLDPWQFLQAEATASGVSALPECWDVTSDSIAARAGECLGACELVLLKSALPSEPFTRAYATQTGYVDAFFATAAARLPAVRCVNLRGANWPECLLAAN
ncbi:MAG: hypothetical protein K1X74_22450 [Pirellulales bacterium]|nr:hypothetical protein [Pirellulales bacterium]